MSKIHPICIARTSVKFIIFVFTYDGHYALKRKENLSEIQKREFKMGTEWSNNAQIGKNNFVKLNYTLTSKFLVRHSDFLTSCLKIQNLTLKFNK